MIYARYRELGGQYVTIGSDAHSAEAVGMNFKMAQDMTDFVGLRPVWFRERKIEYI